MKTSELESALKGKLKWECFCAAYKSEKYKLFHRKDGVETSGDLNLRFNTDEVVVTKAQIKTMCFESLDDKISTSELQFIATAILLSGFEFDSDNSEEVLLFLSAPNSGLPLTCLEIRQGIEMISTA